MSEIELPFPWKEIAAAATEDETSLIKKMGIKVNEETSTSISRDAILEQLAGCSLTYEDMTESDISKDNMMPLPRSVRSYYVMGHRWVRIRNMETDLEVELRLQSRMPESREVYIAAIIIPFDQGRELNGNDLRDIPVAAIAAAYSRHEVQKIILINRAFVLGTSAPSNPMDKLPKASGSDRFLALVGRQYDALEESHPGQNIARLLADHNGTKLPNAQRWIATARKRGFLAPVSRGQRPTAKRRKGPNTDSNN